MPDTPSAPAGPAGAIALVLDASDACWNGQDYRGLRALWDARELEPWYIAEQIEKPLIGWPALERYWQSSLGLLERTDVRHSDLHVKRIGPDLALAVYMLRFSLKPSSQSRAMSGESRVTALFRRRHGKWRYSHYAEAPLSAVAYMQRLFERDAEAGLVFAE